MHPYSLEWWKGDQLGFHLFVLKGCISGCRSPNHHHHHHHHPSAAEQATTSFLRILLVKLLSSCIIMHLDMIMIMMIELGHYLIITIRTFCIFWKMTALLTPWLICFYTCTCYNNISDRLITWYLYFGNYSESIF